MSPEFLRALERTIKIEGGYVDNEYDKGGPTNLGVTFNTLDRWYKRLHRSHAVRNFPFSASKRLTGLRAFRAAESEICYKRRFEQRNQKFATLPDKLE